MEAIKKHVLIFSEAVTLAHLARCVTLANALLQHDYQITLAADSRYNSVSGGLSFRQIPLHSVSSEYFAQKLAQGMPLYNEKILSAYVAEDLDIIRQVKPDFIIGDFRLSLAISSRLTKIPYASVTNAYWSPYAEMDYPIPELPLTKMVGVKIAQHLFNLVRPLVFTLHSLAFNRTCKRFGLPPLAYDMREVYTHADFTLYADIESLLPMKSLPKNHIFIGPLLWSAEVPLPEWWESLPAERPVVFVTLGSSGESRLLPLIMETLAEMQVTAICVTVKKTVVAEKYTNIYVTDFLPSEIAVKKADIVICNGGSPMVYQSLSENKQIIGIPSNLDQYLMMSLLLKAGRGQMVRSGKANRQSIRAVVNQALAETKNTALPRLDCRLAIEKITCLIDAV